MNKISLWGIVYPKKQPNPLFRTMKITLFLTFFFAFGLYAENGYSQNARVTISNNKVSLESILNEIENQTGYLFVVNSHVNIDTKVSVQVKDRPVSEVLHLLFADTPIHYALEGTHIVLSDKFNSKEDAMQQERKITGNITDEAGEPLIGATILIKGTSTGAVTDTDGQFAFYGTVDDRSVLQVSYIGMVTAEVRVGTKTVFQIRLLPDTKALDEVIVVGYGIQRKRDVTGSVVSIKSAQLAEMPQTTITQALQGKIAGVQISTTSSTAEGNENKIRIRGQNSISADGSPLIVVDGIPYSGFLSEINPMDIESLEILKDASSAAIYGARAANGVILVSTRKGNIGKVSVSYDGYYGFDKTADLPEMMNAEEFYRFKVERKGTNMITVPEQEEYEKGTDTRWMDLATRTGQRHQHNLSVSGGTESTRYFFSGSFGKVMGIAKNDNFDRYTVRINLDSKISSWLKIGTSTQLGYFGRNGEKANIAAAFKMNPLNVPFNDDGSVNFMPWEGDSNVKNPLENLNYVKEDVARSVLSNNYLQIDFPFIRGLSYRMNAGYNYRYRLIETYRGRDTLEGDKVGGSSTVNNQGKEDWTLENILTYNRTFGAHTIGITGLYSAQRYTEKFHDNTAVGFPGDYMTYYQSKYATSWAPSDAYSRTSTISQMLRINYNYAGKYLLTLTGRHDGFSAFGANSKFGFFPSVALGWNIDQEKFMNKTDWLDRLKVRMSYGENGNQAISAYSSLPTMSNENYLNDKKETVIGFYPNKLADPTLSWETTRSFNFGLDYSFLRGRILGSVDIFSSRTYDLLLNKVIPQINGVGSIRQNIGKTGNKGVEWQVSTVNVRNKDFSWTTDLNISHTRNKIIDVGIYDADGKAKDNVANTWFIGKPIGVVYACVFDGIWQAGDDIAHSHMPEAKPGDVKIKDTGGPDGIPDGKITADDKQVIGYKDPKWIGGVMNTFRYKNLSLSFFITTVQGITRFTEYNNTFFDGTTNIRKREWWTPENPIHTYPANRDDSNPYGLNYFGKSNDAGYWRLNDVTLSYKFPKNLLRKLRMNSLEMYVNAKNLVTITDYVGLDPELNADYGVPQTRSYLIGLRFNL